VFFISLVARDPLVVVLAAQPLLRVMKD